MKYKSTIVVVDLLKLNFDYININNKINKIHINFVIITEKKENKNKKINILNHLKHTKKLDFIVKSSTE
jgi:16S rRNA U1498 N3-methylase RsmE